MSVSAVSEKQSKAAESRELLRREIEMDLAIEKKRCLDYSYFFRPAWGVIEPVTPLKWNWHLTVICEELQKQAERIAARNPKEYDLVFNVPPRSLKSTAVSKLLIPYVWTRFPGQKFLTSSYDSNLALEHSVDSRTLIQSPWYQRHWGHSYELVWDQNVKSYYRNNFSGYRIATQVGTGTGRGGDWVIADDPISADQAESDVYREGCIRWWTRTMSSRLNDPTVGIRIIIMHRLHEEDLTGHVMRTEAGKYKMFCFPGEESDDISPKEYRSKYVNGYLFPSRLGPETLADLKTRLGEYGYAGQIQQRPTPPEGGMFKRQWWRFWKPRGMQLPNVTVRIGKEVHTCQCIDLPDSMEDSICSWDMALVDHKDSDYHAGGVWGKVGPDLFLLDLVRGKYNPLEATEEAKMLKMNYPRTSAVLIEATAAGATAIADLKRTISSVKPVNPTKNKRLRAIPYSKLCQNGNVYLPHPALAKWVDAFIDEHAAFDKGVNDDQVDQGSQAVDHLLGTRRVFGDYRGENASFRIEFSNILPTSRLVISEWVEKNLTTSVLFGLWNNRSSTLYVFDEYTTENPRPELVIAGAIALMKRDSAGNIAGYKDLKRFHWFGNDIMFGLGIGDMKEAYAKYKIIPQPLTEYDEFGAIMRGSRFITRKQLTIHTRCALFRDQMNEWSVEDKEPADGHGLCRAFCQMVLALTETGAMTVREKAMKDYSKERSKYLTSLENLTGERLNQAAAGKLTTVKTGERDGWVV